MRAWGMKLRAHACRDKLFRCFSSPFNISQISATIQVLGSRVTGATRDWCHV